MARVTTGVASDPGSLAPDLIAPCGMNCGVCSARLRAKNTCEGCRSQSALIPKYCTVCRIRNCEEIAASASGFCFECAGFPCTRLRQLDKRYRTRYGMSMIENLESIRDRGLDRFVDSERVRWTCSACGQLITVHKPSCIHCGEPRS